MLISPDSWHEQGQTYSYRGHQIFYRRQGFDEDAQRGAAPVLLLIHGFPTASWDWHRVWPGLARHFRLLAADMIGFGFSAKPAGYPYSIHDQATLHEELVADLGIDSCHILAHDYGDSVAQELLARHQERHAAGEQGLEIHSTAFLNGGLLPGQHRPRLIQRLLMTPLGPLLSRLLSRRQFDRSFSAVFAPQTRPDEAEIDAFWQLITHNRGHRRSHELIRYMADREVHHDRWVDILRTTSVPHCLIDGPLDPVSGRHLAEAYRELVPNAPVTLLEGIGHYPQMEAPERTLEAYLEFAAPWIPAAEP